MGLHETYEAARRVLHITPSDPDSEARAVNAVLFNEFHVPSWQDPELLSKSRLRNEVKRVTARQLEDKVVYANSGGHGLLAKLEEMTTAIERLNAKDEETTTAIERLTAETTTAIERLTAEDEQKTTAIERLTAKDEQKTAQLKEHQNEVTLLKGQVGRLIQSSEGYRAIRRRFLDVYQRDIKGIKEFKGSKAIQTGNLRALEGDALGDAVLFNHDGRSDSYLYRELYGLDFEQVLNFHSANEDGGLFLVLNAHATMLAQGKPPSDDLETAFQSFLIKVKKYWLQPPNKEPNTPLGSAYYTFWRKFNKEAYI